jgi:hypothetical protein
VFAAGLTTLGLELAASRLLGSTFGTSNVVWANVIGLILVYLALGYYLGGRFADRHPHVTTFYRLVAWAAFVAGLIPLLAQPMLRWGAQVMVEVDTVVLFGSLAAMLALFSIPITMLGMVSPFAIRLVIQDTSMVGRAAGRIYAISTLGSILGTFLPVLVLIPALGTSLTFFALAGCLLVMALVGLTQVDWRGTLPLLWMPVALIVVTILVI